MSRRPQLIGFKRMLASHQQQAAIELAQSLAQDIARAAPDCASKAMQISAILQDLSVIFDHGFVQDVIDVETLDTELSETKVRVTAAAVVGALANRVPK